jgi:hypothetical protein
MPKLRAAFYRLLELGPDFTDRSHVYFKRGARSGHSIAEGAGGGTRTHGLALTRRLLYQLSYSGAKNSVALVEHGSILLMEQDLPLNALEGIIDRLRIAAELLGHLLVGVSFEIQP